MLHLWTTTIHSFIHTISVAPLQVHYAYYSESLPTQHGYCVGISLQSATGNYELRTCPRLQGPYVAARVGFEPATLQTKGDESTYEPPRPTCIYTVVQ